MACVDTKSKRGAQQQACIKTVPALAQPDRALRLRHHSPSPRRHATAGGTADGVRSSTHPLVTHERIEPSRAVRDGDHEPSSSVARAAASTSHFGCLPGGSSVAWRIASRAVEAPAPVARSPALREPFPLPAAAGTLRAPLLTDDLDRPARRLDRQGPERLRTELPAISPSFHRRWTTSASVCYRSAVADRCVVVWTIRGLPTSRTGESANRSHTCLDVKASATYPPWTGC